MLSKKNKVVVKYMVHNPQTYLSINLNFNRFSLEYLFQYHCYLSSLDYIYAFNRKKPNSIQFILKYKYNKIYYQKLCN